MALLGEGRVLTVGAGIRVDACGDCVGAMEGIVEGAGRDIPGHNDEHASPYRPRATLLTK